MKQIYTQIKKSAFYLFICGGIFIFLLGAVITFFSCKTFFLYFLHPTKDLFETPSSEYSDGDWYTCDNNILYDYYASDNHGRYYVTSTNDGEYFGFYVFEKNYDTADEISNDTYDYLDGLRDSLSDSYLSGKGYMVPMSSLEKRYFDNFFEGEDYDVSDYKVKYYNFVLCKPLDILFHDEGEHDVFFTIMGIIFLVSGICMIIHYIRGGYKKTFKKSMEDYGIIESTLENDMAYARQFNSFYIGSNHIIQASFNGKVIPFSAIVWAYVLVTKTQHKIYGVIPSGTTTTYQLIFFDRKKRRITMDIKNEDEGHTILNEIQSRAPYILYGYSSDLADATNGNGFWDMVKTVDERRNNFQQSDHQEQPVMQMNAETY